MFKKNAFILFCIFLTAFIIKAGLSFLMTAPFIFSDEACVIARAAYFSEHFKMISCAALSQAGAGDPFPLYSILISPIYFFLSGIKAYYGVLVYNSLLVATLTFPLYSIFKKFLGSKLVVFGCIIVTLFISEIVIFEKTLMTETIFIIINIWCLHFYLNSFFENKIKNKILALLLAILASLARPFGFILPLALAVNEFFISSNKKKSLIYFFPAAAMISIAIFVIWPELSGMLYSKLISLNENNNLFLFLKAFKNQINSFTVATFIVPLLLFLIHLGEKDSPALNKIRYFLISFIVLNFAVSMQHIYGYYLEDNAMDLMTRYINPSLVYIFIFSIIFLIRYKSSDLNLKNILIIILVLSPLFFFDYEEVKHSQNLDLSLYFNTHEIGLGNVIKTTDFLGKVFLPVSLILFVLFVKNKRKTLTFMIIFIILLHSALSFNWIKNFVIKERPVSYEFFKDEEFTILFLEKEEESTMRDLFWYQLALTKNKVYGSFFIPPTKDKHTLTFPLGIGNMGIIDTPDIIVTMHNLDYPEIGPDYLEMNFYAPKLAKVKSNDQK